MTKNAILLYVVLCSPLLFAQKQENAPPPPLLTQDQKIELLTLQRDAAIKAVEAQPYLLRMQQANERLQSKIQERMKGVDQDKWSLDFMTLGWVPVTAASKHALRDAVPSEGKANPSGN